MVMTGLLLILATFGTSLLALSGAGYVMQRYQQRREREPAPCPVADPTDAIYDTTRPRRAAGRRCWQMNGCSLAERSRCPAYRRPYLPCWLAVELANGGQPKAECLTCPRYKSGLVG